MQAMANHTPEDVCIAKTDTLTVQTRVLPDQESEHARFKIVITGIALTNRFAIIAKRGHNRSPCLSEIQRLVRRGYDVCSAIDGLAGVAMAHSKMPARGCDGRSDRTRWIMHSSILAGCDPVIDSEVFANPPMVRQWIVDHPAPFTDREAS
jgi:hypothetical protein